MAQAPMAPSGDARAHHHRHDAAPQQHLAATMHRPSHLFLLPLVAALLGAAAMAAQAAPPGARRLQISIDLRRDAAQQSGADRSRSQLTQQVLFSAVLHSDGTPSSTNPLDPDDGRRQLERAQRTQQRVQAALARHGSPATVAAAPALVDMQAMQARAQQMQARCGSDRDCLMREATALGAAQVAGGDRALQSRLQGYGSAVQACERSSAAGAAREACITNARRQAGGGADETDQDETLETPYLHFRGQGSCALDVTTRIDERIEGHFQDVQGTVPFTQTMQAEQRQRDKQFCPLLQAVLDTRSGRLWTHVATWGTARGVTVRSEKGRAPQRGEGDAKLQWHESGDWLQRRLSNLDAGGEDGARLPAAGGHTEVKLRWRFEPV